MRHTPDLLTSSPVLRPRVKAIQPLQAILYLPGPGQACVQPWVSIVLGTQLVLSKHSIDSQLHSWLHYP